MPQLLRGGVSPLISLESAVKASLSWGLPQAICLLIGLPVELLEQRHSPSLSLGSSGPPAQVLFISLMLSFGSLRHWHAEWTVCGYQVEQAPRSVAAGRPQPSWSKAQRAEAASSGHARVPGSPAPTLNPANSFDADKSVSPIP